MPSQPLFEETFLHAQWSAEFDAFQASPEAAVLLARLRAWATRDVLNERASETAFIQRFFVDTWGYHLQGHETQSFTCRPQFEVGGAGQTGGTGFADLALGHFGTGRDGVAQVLCEFKDIRSGLDAKQARKGNTRSPVEQAFDYLHSAWQNRNRDTLVEPFFAVVTDMNEFRLYARRHGRGQFQRFVIKGQSSVTEPTLLDDTAAAAFRRFVFWKIFQPAMLLTERGTPALDRLWSDQIVREKAIERDFYHEYRDYREFVYRTLVTANPGFTGSRGQLVRLTQRFLDRCIFILFCEDMGRVLRYPPALLRDILIEKSQSRFYDPAGPGPWNEMRDLFRAMRDGGNFGQHPIDRFNGGLFEQDPDLDSLHIPAKVFCAAGQADQLLGHPRTLLHFSAKYNFGLSSAAGERAISLYTLGRIFEQSITELEIMEAEADGRVSINKLSKRKTDGVYYTLEWIVNTIIEQTVGARLDDIKFNIGFDRLPVLDEAAINQYRKFILPLKVKRREGISGVTAPEAGAWIAFFEKYRFHLGRIRIVDPACGSGAFLIQALNRLIEEYQWIVAEEERITGQRRLFDRDDIIRSILSHNIYGVDINPESVEITKLALWLHTAAPGKPLCSLDANIRCGNSLVGPDFAEFYNQRHENLFAAADENERERINAFDWRAAFPDVFAHGGFDCVIGNPPYIKLQHFRRAQADTAAYLVEAKNPDGTPLYESTQSGNFDMYLPFIEKGIRLLKPEGRMGYIAPNVWMVNEYGKPLRQLIRRTRTLDRWLDFKSFQVFDEAITYTSLQFFRGAPNEALTCAFAPDGNAAAVQWENADQIPYEELPEETAWNLAPKVEMDLISKLAQSFVTLGNDVWTKQIFQGFKTSGDDLYIAEKISNSDYQFTYPNSEKRIHEIEQSVMYPVIAGAESKRYEMPFTKNFILVPYVTTADTANAIDGTRLAASYPKLWGYLQARKTEFETRESGRMIGNEQWWSYIYPKNLRQMKEPKLLVAGTAPGLRVAIDTTGEFAFMGGRVYGILPSDVENLEFLAGILNSKIAEFVFKRIARPKAGGFYDIETQFLAPLPIPAATPEQRMEVGTRARELQDLHTLRRDTIAKLDQRLSSAQTTPVTPHPRKTGCGRTSAPPPPGKPPPPPPPASAPASSLPGPRKSTPPFSRTSSTPSTPSSNPAPPSPLPTPTTSWPSTSPAAKPSASTTAPTPPSSPPNGVTPSATSTSPKPSTAKNSSNTSSPSALQTKPPSETASSPSTRKSPPSPPPSPPKKPS